MSVNREDGAGEFIRFELSFGERRIRFAERRIGLEERLNRAMFRPEIETHKAEMEMHSAEIEIVCRSYVDVEESMQNLKNPCDSYNEFSSKELMCEPTSPSAPRSPGNSGQEIEDDIMTSFAPVFEQRLHDALEPILGPVACELRSEGEEARKERERLIALKKQKLALNLKELKRLQRRRPCRVQHSRRAPSAFIRRRRQGQGHHLRFPWTPNN